jgi:hypothetical protein
MLVYYDKTTYICWFIMIKLHLTVQKYIKYDMITIKSKLSLQFTGYPPSGSRHLIGN